MGRLTSPVWSEEHRLTARLEVDGASRWLGLATQVGHYHQRGRSTAGFQALVAQAGSAPIVIAECDIAMPDVGWELRASGLWADHNCETPLVHWSYGLEAFALAIDDPAELLGRARGDRTPLGWELDFEGDPEDVHGLEASAYHQSGEVSGLILLAEGELMVSGPAVRSHRWHRGHYDHPSLLVAGERGPTTGDVALPTVDGTWWVEASPTAIGTMRDFD